MEEKTAAKLLAECLEKQESAYQPWDLERLI